MSHISFSFKPTFNTLLICLQLRVSAELYTIRTVGHRLRDSRQADLTDHTPEQISWSGPTRWPKGRLVSTVAPSYCAPRYYADTDIRRGRGSRFFAARGKYQTGLLKHT